MLEILLFNYAAAAKWLNDNQGVAGVGVFLLTLLLGWVSGIFAALRRKPKLKISLIEGPSFCCTFSTGLVRDNQQLNRVAIALYLAITNVGSAATSLSNISVGYHWHIRPFSLDWLRYRVGWFWLHDQVAAINDFQSLIGENIKLYPFLTQKSNLSSSDRDTFLEPGNGTNGVVYFEQPDCSGGCFPSPARAGTPIKVAIRDVFGTTHYAKFTIPAVSLKEGRLFNPSFGKTYAVLRNETLPQDRHT